tara:strand:- start:75 stop:539 length:465 start_codon:yes stop_codon:yes gene_type:complete
MPTRVEKLEKRKDRVVEKATDKINRQQYGGRTFKKMNKRKRNIDKKIVNTKARVATRTKKKVDKVVKKVEKLQERKARVINKGTRGKSQAKSNAKIKAAVAKGKTKKAARIDKRQINKNMRTGFAIGKKLNKIDKKVVKAGGPARVIKTGKKKK